MKRFNYFVMSLISAAAFTFTACSSSDDLGGSTGKQEVAADGVYMTLSVVGSSANRTRTTGDKTENGTDVESTIGNGTLYIYDGTTCVFKRNLSTSDWASAPTETKAGTTKPIRVSVNSVDTNKPYNVYFLANNTTISDPLAANAAFTASTTGGADYATNNAFVMFNQNDGETQANQSTVTFTDAAKNVDTPAAAQTIKLDRVVARIDAPTVDAEVKTVSDEAKTVNVKEYIKGIQYVSYAVSNLNNNSYVMQTWKDEYKTLVPYLTSEKTYYKAYADYGDKYTADGLDNFTTNEATPKNYCFENTTPEIQNATSIYFKIQTELTDLAKADADFDDGTFYRYDGRLYTSLKQIFKDAEDGTVANPFAENGTTTADKELAKIKDQTTGKLIDEGVVLANFRKTYKINIYRGGVMYYRWAIADNYYKTTEAYSVLRNSIYRLNVTQISEIGRDVPNGPDDDQKPNYYMNVTVSVNPWVFNTQDINLK